MRPLLVIGAGGLLLWYLNSKGYLSGLFGATTTSPTTTTPPATGGTTNPPAPPSNSLAAIFTRLQADAGAQAASTGLTAYGWNYSLARVSSITPPDPLTLWDATTAAQNMTAAQYWAVMAPALTSSFGLSGMRGLGRMNTHGGWAA